MSFFNLNSLLRALPVLLLVGHLSATETPKFTVGVWSAEIGKTAPANPKPNPALNWLGAAEVKIPDPANMTLVADKTAPGGTALVFTSSQTEAATVNRKLTEDSRLQMRLHAKPNADGPGWQTVIYFFRAAEVRYFPTRRVFKLIVWPNDTTTAQEVELPANPDTWNAISVNVVGGTFTLTVNGKSVSGTQKDGRMMWSGTSQLSLGYGSGRPFSGALADVHVGQVL